MPMRHSRPLLSPRQPACCRRPAAGQPGVLLALGSSLLLGLALCGLVGCAAGSDLSGAEVPTPQLTQPSWQTDYPTGEGPIALVLTDLNSDGLRDVAVVNGIGASVSLYLADGGGLLPGKEYPVGRGAQAIAALQLDDDARDDLVIANAADNTLFTLLSKGQKAGEFVAGPAITGIENPSILSTADVTGDGIPDLIVGSSGTDLITVLENKKTGGTLTRIGAPFSAGPDVRGLALLPLDASQPGRLDLAVARAGRDEIGLFRNDGGGRFTLTSLPLGLPPDSTPISVAAAELDGVSGSVELAVLSHGTGQLGLAQAVGGGRFMLSSTAIGPKPAALAIGAIDRDALLDMAVAVPSQELVATVQNLGAERWPMGMPTDFYASPGLPTALAIADMNGDGRGDLLVVCREADRLRILGPAGTMP